MNNKTLLKKILETEFCQGSVTDWDEIKRITTDPHFKKELRDAILNSLITPKEFEELTSVEREDQAEVNKFLKEIIWDRLYPNEPLE